MLEHHGRRFQVVSRLGELVERGAISMDRRSELRGPDEQEAVDNIEAAARGRAAGGNKAQALELSTRALELDPENLGLQSLHKDLQRSLVAELSRELLGTFRVPKLLITPEEVARLDLGDHERYLVGRVDGHWDLLSLIRVAPIREVDALLTFKRLRDRGIIEL